MEVPGRDVTADALGPDTETPRTGEPAPSGGTPVTEPSGVAPADAPASREDDDDGESLKDKVREVADKVKDAVTPDRDERV